jgi:tetratricopeptide (TPR) repeat protein
MKRCLEKTAARRYQQAGELRAALEAVQPNRADAVLVALRRHQNVWRRLSLAVAALGVAAVVVALGVEPLRTRLGRLAGEPAIAFAARDWLLVTEFDNQTGDRVFDRALNTALSAALTQSTYVNVVPANRIREVLRRMRKTPPVLADEATAREIAVREGFRMVLVPAITSTGGSYLLAASLVDPSSGVTLKSETVSASGKDDVLSAVDQLSGRIRADLGEASALIAKQSKPLLQATTSSLEALRSFSLGQEAHEAQQLDKARALYEEALRIDPSFTSARVMLGIMNVEFFDRAKGVELISQAMGAIDGLTDHERHIVLAFHAMVIERNLEKTAALHRAFLALHPDSAGAHNNLGRVYMQMRRFDAAIAEFEEAIRLEPSVLLPYSSLSSIYLYQTGNLDAAIAVSERQLAHDDRSAAAHFQIGSAYLGKNDLQQAEAKFRRSLDLDPGIVFNWYSFGHTLRLQRRYEEARRTHAHILELAPEEMSAHYEVGAVSQLMGDEAAARRSLRTVITSSEQALRANPNDIQRRLELAAAHARLGNKRQAETIARQVAERAANLPVERAGLQVLLGRKAEALDTLQRAVDNGYRNVVWMRMLVDLHELQGDPSYEAIIAKARQ